MNFFESQTYLETLIPKDFRADLKPMAEVCDHFGNPQLSYPTVHVCGTNGKGSTCAFLQNICAFNGFKTGRMISPHLIRLTERIHINAQEIDEESVVLLTDEIREKTNDLTYFEFLPLLGFLFFQRQQIDIAVIETGLGGRWDATNVVKPHVAVITSISFDHMRHLGNTLTAITTEKCGILKEGMPVVTAQQPDEVMQVIEQISRERGCELFVADPRMISSPLGLAGEHQKQNAACAAVATSILKTKGFSLSNIEKALLKTTWPGRLEYLLPNVLLDGAHNEDGCRKLAAYLRAHCDPFKTILVFGVFRDKNYEAMLRFLQPCVAKIVIVRAPSHRAAEPDEIAAIAVREGAKVSCKESIEETFDDCFYSLAPDETLVIAGSLSVVGAVRKHVGEHYGISHNTTATTSRERTVASSRR